MRAKPKAEDEFDDFRPFSNPSDKLVDEALELFQARYDRQLTRSEARQMLLNLTNYFLRLAYWERRQQKREAAATGATSKDG